MKKLILICISLFAIFFGMQGQIWADEPYIPSIELEKVIGNVYVGRQGAPLHEILDTEVGTYLMMNLYVIASEDRSEVVLIDMPGLPELWMPFMSALQTEFPGAQIKAVLLTHDHIDHCWSIPYFYSSGIPVYASSVEISYPESGMYDIPLTGFATPIEPGFYIMLSDGAVIQAVDLTGHTPGHMGYAYYPDGDDGKINWFFAGDAVMAPLDHGANEDSNNITYFVRLDVLINDTFSYEAWAESLIDLKGMLKKNARLFPGHGAVREGYFWKDPLGYIDHTVSVLQSLLP